MRVLYTATLVRGHIAKFHTPYLRWFKEQGWETWVAARNDCPNGICEIPDCDHFVDIPFPRSPFSLEIGESYHSLKSLIDSTHFDIVHTHTPVASVLTRWACRSARKRGTSVLYTAHGFHFFRGAPLLNWLLWYSVERVMTRCTDVLLTINREDYKRAMRFAHCDVRLLHGVGVDIARFRDAKAYARSEWGFADEDFLLLCVGDLVEGKNQRLIVKALAQLPSWVKLVLCGVGPDADVLVNMAQAMDLSNRIEFLGFRTDIPRIIKSCDAFVFPSKREGLPVSVIEAMASGLVVIASPVRGVSPDLIDDGQTGYLLESPDDLEGIVEKVLKLSEDASFAGEMRERAYQKVRAYDIAITLAEMEDIYRGLPAFRDVDR